MKKLLLALVLVLSMTACKKKADTGAYGKTLKAQLDSMGYKDAKVSCPSDVEMKKGNKFQCTITIDKKDYKWETVIGEVDKDNNAQIESAEFVGDQPPPPGGEEGGEEAEGGEGEEK